MEKSTIINLAAAELMETAVVSETASVLEHNNLLIIKHAALALLQPLNDSVST